jgi:hypothetical protein
MLQSQPRSLLKKVDIVGCYLQLLRVLKTPDAPMLPCLLPLLGFQASLLRQVVDMLIAFLGIGEGMSFGWILFRLYH